MTETAVRVEGSFAQAGNAAPPPDEIKKEVILGRVQSGPLWHWLAWLGGTAGVLFYLWPDYGTAAVAASCIAQSVRLSQLYGEPLAVRRKFVSQMLVLAFCATPVLVAQWLAAELDGVFLIGFLVRCFYLLSALALVVNFLFIYEIPPESVPRQPAAVLHAIVTVPDFEKLRSEILAGADELATLTVFDANIPEVVAAWNTTTVGGMEKILTEGGALTRTSWRRGISIFNTAVAHVDTARNRLRDLLRDAEVVLSAYRIDYASLDVKPSMTLEGYAPVVAIKHDLTQKLNYGQGYARVLQESMRGNLPWYVTSLAFVGLMAVTAINASKARRQLHEMQGKLIVDAEAAKGDFVMFAALLKTRVLPQFDGLVETSNRLECEMASVMGVPSATESSGNRQDQPIRVARIMIEARHLLGTMAGN